MSGLASSAFSFGVDIPKERLTLGLPVIDTGHAYIHEGIAFTLSGTLSVTQNQVGAISLIPPAAVAATVTLNMTAATSDLTYTAKTAGVAGNGISVVHLDPGAASQALAVSFDEVNKKLTVSLATGANSAITSTAALVKAAVNANATAAKWLTCEDEGDGSGLVNALAQAYLTGGAAAVYVHLKPGTFSASAGPVTITLREVATFASGDAVTPRNRKRSASASRVPCVANANATVAIDGTGYLVLQTLYINASNAGAVKNGASSPAEDEWILKPGVAYALCFANTNAGASIIGYDLFWYEEVGE